MPALPTIDPTVKFHLSLNVRERDRAVAFYRTFFGTEPAKCHVDYAKFEVDIPPLVFSLVPSHATTIGGALNHVGLRLPDSARLVDVQRRLETAGFRTVRQEGVECCYSRQTKFWATDPDGVMWELYTLHDDIGHHGADLPPAPATPSARWQHRLGEPVPDRVPHADASLETVALEGTFNADVPPDTFTRLLEELFRALKPGGTLEVHGLVGDRSFPGRPQLPGMASVVQRVPAADEAEQWLERTGFAEVVHKLAETPLPPMKGVHFLELRLTARKPTS
jgi:catechol 2,3-dioxygenase-like lactoylglutathione lyase family enzyme